LLQDNAPVTVSLINVHPVGQVQVLIVDEYKQPRLRPVKSTEPVNVCSRVPVCNKALVRSEPAHNFIPGIACGITTQLVLIGSGQVFEELLDRTGSINIRYVIIMT